MNKGRSWKEGEETDKNMISRYQLCNHISQACRNKIGKMPVTILLLSFCQSLFFIHQSGILFGRCHKRTSFHRFDFQPPALFFRPIFADFDGWIGSEFSGSCESEGRRLSFDANARGQVRSGRVQFHRHHGQTGNGRNRNGIRGGRGRDGNWMMIVSSEIKSQIGCARGRPRRRRRKEYSLSDVLLLLMLLRFMLIGRQLLLRRLSGQAGQRQGRGPVGVGRQRNGKRRPSWLLLRGG